ncbi:MAG: hypothetical protein IH606_11785 [Burkholderiales bacterium]|nr:hypothetical protein [Burkholderiales bacterium]
MSTTIVLTGLLPFVVLAAALLAFPVCFVLLRLYRNSVSRGMARVGGSDTASLESGAGIRTPAARLEFRYLDADTKDSRNQAGDLSYQRAVRGPWRASIVYAAGGLCYSLLMTAGWLLATRDKEIVWSKLLILSWTYFWPVILTILLIAAYDSTRRWQLFGAYFAMLAVLIAIAVARNPEMGVGSLPLYWVITNGPATVLLFTFLIRPIRAVGPLVLVFLLALAAGSQSVLSVAGANEGLLRAITGIGLELGLGAHGIFIAMILVGMAAFAFFGWPLLRLLGKRYEQKKFSEQSIMLDALWLLFGVVQSIGFAFEGAAWILTGPVAFIGYKLVSSLGLRWTTKAPTDNAPKTLLLLRVFALAKRSEQLFDKLRKHWQYAGSISMIAGPDLVTTTIEPHEFLDFVSGRLGRQFVSDGQDLERRVKAIDPAPDPDGRYRINEFFCHNDTWQITMERLAAMSDALLMDLRSFSPANQGCIFELGRLINSVDLNRVVFLVDHTTDRAFLESTLLGLWQTMSADSPNQSAGAPPIKLFRIERQSGSELKTLLRFLLGAPSRTTPA